MTESNSGAPYVENRSTLVLKFLAPEDQLVPQTSDTQHCGICWWGECSVHGNTFMLDL